MGGGERVRVGSCQEHIVEGVREEDELEEEEDGAVSGAQRGGEG